MPTTPAAQTTTREGYVDVFRGLLIAHMALDHASLMYNRGRGGEELWAVPPGPPVDFWQFFTRFTGVPVAPAFCFMAGFMVAATTASRVSRGVAPGVVTRRLVTRGLVLIAVDTVIMGLPRAAMGFYSFMVLSSIGVSLILLALIRDLPLRWLAALSAAILTLHPLLRSFDGSALPVPLRAILYEPVRTGHFRSLYPVIPWLGVVLAGYVVGRDATTRERPERLWLPLAAAAFALFLVVRLAGGYGNAHPYSSVASYQFWSFSKYPPDLPFELLAFGSVFAGLTLVRALCKDGTPPWLAPFAVYGRVSFFFYVVHFYLLGPLQGLLRRRFDLGGTVLIWLGLLIVMLPICSWYFRKKTERPNFVTRYL